MASKKDSDAVNLLDCIPVRIVEWEKKEDDCITLLKPKFANRLFRRYVLPHMKKPCYRIYLDTYGSYVWSLCDGVRTVAEIGKELQKEHGEGVEPVYDRLALYVRQLARARFIELSTADGQVSCSGGGKRQGRMRGTGMEHHPHS